MMVRDDYHSVRVRPTQAMKRHLEESLMEMDM